MVDAEEKLTEELKTGCEKEGQEKWKEKNYQKAGEVIHKIGLLYRQKSNDKFALIRSAGLLNAAIFRNPSNVSKTKSDLSDLCKHILQQAKAKNPNADLVKEAELIKSSITVMRKEVEVFFRSKVPKIQENITSDELKELKLNKISNIRNINKIIAIKYKDIMKKLIEFCQNVMGEPPCDYAIVGMGSLAREEITPYSDFEHIILLRNDANYKAYLPYFKWFAVIFHVVILNLQETIIPSLDISSLSWLYDDKTPRGISLDGMMPHASKFPLGNLIHPVSEMLKYLNPESLSNDYHLAVMLTKTCFVFGNQDIFQQFLDGIQIYQTSKLRRDIVKDFHQLVREDLDKFSVRLRITDLTSQETINIKKFVYRSTTIFIPALGSIHQVSGNSSFEIIDEMAKHNKITENTADKLRCAIAIACEMRLRVYIVKQRQCDDAIDLKQDDMVKFLDIVGVTSTVNYFQIAYCLQCELAKQLNFTKLHFYSNPQLFNIAIGLAFGVKDFLSKLGKPQKYFWDIRLFDFDECIILLETQNIVKSSGQTASKFFEKILKCFSKCISGSTAVSTKLNTEQIQSIASQLKSAKVYDEALDFYKQLLVYHENKSRDTDVDYEVARASDQIGVCLNKLNRPALALKHLNRALEIKQNTTRRESTDRSIAVTLHSISRCYINMHEYEKALDTLNRELEIDQKTTLNADIDRNIASALHTIGRCHTDMDQYSEALTYLQRSLKIKQTASNKSDKYGIAMTLHEIGRCYFELQQYDLALTNLNQALEHKQSDADTEKSIASTLHSIGRCYLEKKQFDTAIKHLNQSLNIKQNITLDADKDKSIASTLQSIGRCQTYLKEYDDALSNLNRALNIKQNITDKTAEQKSIATAEQKSVAVTLHSIGLYFEEVQNYKEALKYLEQSLKIYESLPRNEHINNNIMKIRTKFDIVHSKIEKLKL